MPSLRQSLAFVAVFAALATALLVQSGALSSGYGYHEDEAGHLMSALMLRDYLLSGFSDNPLHFAKNYYLHYPKVTLGHWPPGLAAMLGAWSSAFGTSTASILGFFAALATTCASLIWWVGSAVVGRWIAAFVGALFLFVPEVQQFGHATMTELPLATTCTASVLCFGLFLESGRTKHCVWFAVFATFAILIKGSALALALVPLLSIAMSGRWELLRRRCLWLSAAIPGLLCGPWYFATLSISLSSWGGGASRHPSTRWARPSGTRSISRAWQDSASGSLPSSAYSLPSARSIARLVGLRSRFGSCARRSPMR